MEIRILWEIDDNNPSFPAYIKSQLNYKDDEMRGSVSEARRWPSFDLSMIK